MRLGTLRRTATSVRLVVRGLLACIPLTSVLIVSGCAVEPVEGRRVLVILLDTLRADRLSSFGYEIETSPNLNRLARGGATFLRHQSHASETRGSMPTLLYSRYFSRPVFPHNNKVPLASPRDLFRRADDELVSLPGALRHHGFHTVMVNAHPWLRENTIFADEFDEVHDLSQSHRSDRWYARAEQIADFTLEWIDANRGGDWLLYVHLMDVHSPRYFEDDAEAMLAPENRIEGREFYRDALFKTRVPTEEEKPIFDAIYDGSVHYTDRHVGRIIDRLDESGMLEDTLVVVTSDHGEMLFDRGERMGHGGPLLEPLGHIPLIVHYPPAVEPVVVDRLTEAVDVMPTVMGLLGLDLPAGRRADGVDLSGALAGDPGPGLAFSRNSVRDTRFKLLLSQPPEELLTAEAPALEDLGGQLYDLEMDPLELDDLWDERPEVVERLLGAYRDKLAPHFRRYVAARTSDTPAGDFAISARHFEFEGPEAGSMVEDPGGRWVHSRHWQDYALRGSPRAEPLSVMFPVPNGRYRLSAYVQGDFQIQIGAADPVAVTVGAPGVTELGEVSINDARFTARLIVGAGAIEIRHFGFRPLIDGESLPEEDAERTEQLKSLGYIN